MHSSEIFANPPKMQQLSKLGVSTHVVDTTRWMSTTLLHVPSGLDGNGLDGVLTQKVLA